MNTLKAYEMDDEYTIYAAESVELAKSLYISDCGNSPEDEYPRQLTDAELDQRYPEFDENEKRTGGTVSIREFLNDANHEGYLCGGPQ